MDMIDNNFSQRDDILKFASGTAGLENAAGTAGSTRSHRTLGRIVW